MNILIACEESQTVCKAFRAAGHRAFSCDVLPCSGGRPEWHIQGCAIETAYSTFYEWDMMIAHPPCTYLSVSGLHWNKRRPERAAQTEAAAAFFMKFADLEIPYAIENPVCCMSSRWRKPDQIIQPYEYGHDASKKTCLWLNKLPKLKPTRRVEPRIVNNLPRWSNQTDSGQNRLAPSADRAKIRSKTFQGIADAMASQWGTL